MHLSRREFSAGLLSTLTFSLSHISTVQANTPLSLTWERITLNRLTFGATQTEEANLKRLGLSAWLDTELGKSLIDQPLFDRLAKATLLIEYEADKDENGHDWKALKEQRTYQALDRDGVDLLPLLDFEKAGMPYEERIRPAREVQAASLIRAVHADSQLREVMTQFWHEHFSVNSMKDERTAAYFPTHDRIMRRNALENFRSFLGEVVRSPSMLFYLNNEASKASPANENFARELFELHTLGAENYANDTYDKWGDVPGAKSGLAEVYIDEDVYEAARALTGWSFGDGRGLAENDNAPETGEFHYIDGWHDPYQKRILGVEFAPNGGPMADGEKLLDIVAAHPGTARFICRKIARRLLSDEPTDAIVQSAAEVFLAQKDAPDQIAQVVRQIVLSPEFLNTKPEKLRRPFEFLAGLYRMTGAEISSPQLDFHFALSQSGWTQHEFRPPTGHPDKNDHWANTNYISGLLNIALYAFEDWANAGTLNLGAELPVGMNNTSAATAYLMTRLVSAETATLLANDITLALEGNLDVALSEDNNERNSRLRPALALAAFHPEFLYR